jgi:hypothetical protein
MIRKDLAPLRRVAGEREGPAAREPSAHGLDPWGWEGEVALPSLRRCAVAHLTPAPSPRKRAERERGVP